jgi:hypothetical protein
LAALSLTACGDDDLPPNGDSGTGRDASAVDAAASDAGSTDGGSFDAAALDASGIDGAISDAGMIDAGVADPCDNDRRDGSETDIDCGGTDCAPCENDLECARSTDCASSICIVRRCRAPACSDGVTNGTETDVDCGGTDCAPCANGGACLDAPDCESSICTDSVCVPPSCTDGVLNAMETDIDCGGPTCPGCPIGEMCTVGRDCEEGVCSVSVCAAPTCADGVANGDETDRDCGGPTTCDRCPNNLSCSAPTDCAAGVCATGYCGSVSCVPFGTDPDYIGCSFVPAASPCPDIRATGTATGLGDDGRVYVPIGFTFGFYGTDYTQAGVQANGGISFQDSSLSFTNSCTLRTVTPTHFIAAFWDDLNPSLPGSEVYYETRGTAPNRRFIVQWDTKHRTGDNGNIIAVLHETSNNIQVCYVDTDFGNASYDLGASATARIQNGANNLQYSCNMPNLTTGRVIRYLPR